MKLKFLTLVALATGAFAQNQSIDSNNEWENTPVVPFVANGHIPWLLPDATGNEGAKPTLSLLDSFLTTGINALTIGTDGKLFVAPSLGGEATTYFDDNIEDPTATPITPPATPSLGDNHEELENGFYRKYEWDGTNWIVVSDLDLCPCPELTFQPTAGTITWDDDSDDSTANLVIPIGGAGGSVTLDTTTSGNTLDAETAGVTASSFTIDLTGIEEDEWDTPEAPIVVRAEDTQSQAGWDIDIDSRHGNTIFVATNGVDPASAGALRVHDGETYSNYSQQLPFLTIGMASLAAVEGDTIVVRSGEYDETVATDGDAQGYIEAQNVNYSFDPEVSVIGSVGLVSNTKNSITGYPNFSEGFGRLQITNNKIYPRLEIGSAFSSTGVGLILASTSGDNYANLDIREARGATTGLSISNYELQGSVWGHGELTGVQLVNLHSNSVVEVKNASTPLGTSDNNQFGLRIGFNDGSTNQASLEAEAPVLKLGTIAGSHQGANFDNTTLEYRPIIIEGGQISRVSDSLNLRGVGLFIGNNSKVILKNSRVVSFASDGQSLGLRQAIGYEGGSGVSQTPTPPSSYPLPAGSDGETVLRLENVSLIDNATFSVRQAVAATLYLYCKDVHATSPMETAGAAGTFTGILPQAGTGDIISHGGAAYLDATGSPVDGIHYSINPEYR